MEMFRQIAPTGEVTKTAVDAQPGEDIATLLHGEEVGSVEEQNSASSVANTAVHKDVSSATSAACPFGASQK